MDEFGRHLITGMIAELHQLYRTPDPASTQYHLNTLGEMLSRLKDAVPEAITVPPPRSRNNSQTTTWKVPGLVTTDDDPALGYRLIYHLKEASAVRIATAFLSAADTNPMIQPLRELTESGVDVRLLTSVMGFFNSPDALQAFENWGPNLELRLYHENPSAPDELLSRRSRGFHAKTILIEKKGAPNVMAIGSANLTGGGMQSNVEWNYITDFEVNVALDGSQSGYHRAVGLFDSIWEDRSYRPDDGFFKQYREIYDRGRSLRRRLADLGAPNEEPNDDTSAVQLPIIAPNPAQQTALKRMQDMRIAGVTRYAVIAATGVGKTILSAFDVRDTTTLTPPVQRVLFLVHRRTIVEQAREDYRRVLGATFNYVVVQGQESIARIEGDRVVVFAMVQTLANPETLSRFTADFFDYIVVDEFHHAAAASYQRILDHFAPRFLLGMTATPERSDGQDVLNHCNRTVAYEVRLLEAVDRGWLIPFQYYALYDPADYQQIRWTGTGYDEDELETLLSTDTRADLIVSNLRIYQASDGDRRVLAFCSNVGHARWMAKAFTQRGIPAESLTGETHDDDRAVMIKRLEDRDDPLEVICAVDVLSEGVDIPAVTHVLMLRPTHSFTVFLQQLGRGLRHHPGKSFVVVLDFVGNYRRSYVAPLALSGFHTVPSSVAHGNAIPEFQPPRGCFIGADKQARRIWREELPTGTARGRKLARISHALEELADADGHNERRSLRDIRLPELFVYGREKDDDIAKTLRELGGWLAVRTHLDIASSYERGLQGTAGEAFLTHVEQELSPNRSYKMAVLHSLLDISSREDAGAVRTSWPVQEIAAGFLSYYLVDRRRIEDWPELKRAPQPDQFPVDRTAAHLKHMPLDRLSNPLEKPFRLSGDTFSVAPDYIEYWTDSIFRDLVRERVTYAEARYWNR